MSAPRTLLELSDDELIAMIAQKKELLPLRRKTAAGELEPVHSSRARANTRAAPPLPVCLPMTVIPEAPQAKP